MFKYNDAMLYVILRQSVSEMPWHSTGLHCHTHYHSL